MKFFSTFILLLVALYSYGQADFDAVAVGDLIMVELKNGKKISGKVQAMTGEEVVLESDLGELVVKKATINKLQSAEDFERLNHLMYPEYADSYFLLPSARPMKQGKWYYKNYNLFYNQFSYGVSENLSVSAGFESLSIFAGEFPRVFFVAPKLSFGADNHYFSVGTTLFIVGDDGESAAGGLAFANYTIGDDYKNLTFGTSFGYADGETSPLIFNINGRYPLSDKVSLVSEVIFGDLDGVLFDLGVRVKTKGGLAFDIGFIRTSDSDIFGIPLLGITAPFN